ncbi:MAG: aminomethyl-transferring glycine dehydrogenase subunit GcvPA [Candidatus Krumholzibacteria bacterium]|jgi:glycine dehydrogenase subunit 1|nr:aminomethyl-transferring glycine dehydrogenase subunit GcvPA [Candidatus Krumholzibacteria bacterium]
MPYVPHTPDDVRAMLAAIGAASVDDLFATLPDTIRLRGELDLPRGLSEEEVRRFMQDLAGENITQADLVSFLGGGIYDAIIPAACDAIACRSEFLTAYTPYQAEVSQGTLQMIYEWQTFITRLTGLPVANASMYDGATALGEALILAIGARRKRKVVLPALLNPRWRRVAATMLRGFDVQIVEAPAAADGTTDPAAVARLADADTAAVVVQNPNYLGLIEPVQALAAAGKAQGALLVAAVNPVSLSLLAAPGEYGADLAVGEAQPFGIPSGGGGPLLGFFAASEALMRRMPGRVVGRTVDRNGNPAYTLTLQTREQHIRREKATSNICSNQGLNALRATVYLAMLGGTGLVELGAANQTRLAALRREAERIPGVELPFAGPAFNETVVRLPRPALAFRDFARQYGLLAGIPLTGVAGCTENDLLVAVTEKRTAEDIETFAAALAAFASGEEVEW